MPAMQILPLKMGEGRDTTKNLLSLILHQIYKAKSTLHLVIKLRIKIAKIMLLVCFCGGELMLGGKKALLFSHYSMSQFL